MKISDYLQEGAQSARTAKELKTVLHISARDLSELVRAERLDGVPICSRTQTNDDGKAGYFMPKDAADYTATIKHLKAREREIKTVRKALEKAFRNRYGAERRI